MSTPPTPLDGFLRAVERAETPYVLFPEDIGLQFRLDPQGARAAIRLGLFGPWFTVDGQPAVLRDTLREHLRQRSASRSVAKKELITEDIQGPAQEEAGRDH